MDDKTLVVCFQVDKEVMKEKTENAVRIELQEERGW